MYSFQTCDQVWIFPLMWLYRTYLYFCISWHLYASVSSSVNFILFHFCNIRSLSSFSSQIVFYVNKIGKSILLYYFCSYFWCWDTNSWITFCFANVLFRYASKIEKSEYQLRHVSVCPFVHVEELGSHWKNFHEI